MIRPVTLLTLLAAMGAGLHLYQTKHAVALLDRELRVTARQIGEAQERTVALAAEWAWLNEPERLRAVAQKHLALEPMQPSQFVRIAEAERRLVEVERRLQQAPAQPAVSLAVALALEPVRPEVPASVAPSPPPRVEAAAAPPRVVTRPPAAAPRPANSPIAQIAAPAAPPPRSVLLPSSAYAALPPPPAGSALGGSGSLPPPVPFGR